MLKKSLLVQDSTVHAEEDYITDMKDQMQQMIDKEVELQSKIFFVITLLL